jgi:hypothetical protein
MPVLNRRSRIVSFRLSDEEYAAMMESCISWGSRSLSDYARSAACGTLDSREPSREDGKAGRAIRKLKDRVEELDRLVRHLTLEMDSRRSLPGEPVPVTAADPTPHHLSSSRARSD